MNRLHWATLIVIPIFIIGIYAYKDAHIILDKSKKESYVKQDGITSIGYDNGKKVFKVHIDTLTQHNYKHILYSKNITHGIIYDTDQHPVIENIRGNYARINTRVKNIIVTNNVTAKVTPKESTKNIQIKAEHFRYSHYNKVSEFSKHASIHIGSIALSSKAFDFFTKENKIHFKDGISITSKTSTTNANTATLLLNEDLLHATNNIKTTYKKQNSASQSEQIKALTQSNTLLRSEHLHIDYEAPDHPIITYRSNVNVSQPDKSLSANQLRLNFKTKTFDASGTIKIKLKQLNWLKKKIKLTKIKSYNRYLIIQQQFKVITQHLKNQKTRS